MAFKIEIEAANRDRMLDWLENRGGVAVWSSLDLSRAGERTYTPADAEQPSWRFASKPDEVITDRADIGVYTETLFKAFPVSCRRSGNGMMLKLTDPSQAKVERVMAQCREAHGNAHYHRGVLPDKAHSIGVFFASEAVPL